MNQELQLIETENRCPLDIEDVVRHIIKFYDIMNLHQNIKNESNMLDSIKDFQIATLEFSQAKNILVNLLMPEENPYIKEAEENHNWLVDDIGRIDNKLSEFQGSIGSKIEAHVQMGKPNSFVEIYRYYNYLLESMQGLVFYPLVNSTKRFLKLKKNGKITPDDSNSLDQKETEEKIFVYWVFLEMYHASLSLGSITRNDLKQRISKGTTRDKYSPFSRPSRFPPHMEGTDENITDETNVEDLFVDHFGGGNESSE